MFGRKKRAAQPRGQGAAAAKQMGLFMDPEDMMGMEENLDDPDLEAELDAITGNKAAAGGRNRPKGKSPLPMEDIARMADECMRDVDDDEDDDNVEDDEDLLVGAFFTQQEAKASSASSASSAAPGTLQHTLEERAAMYRTALHNAKTSGETSKARRYDRGLKTLQSMLAAVKKGRPVNEAEIPPPVATGAATAAAPTAPPTAAASKPTVPARPPPAVPPRQKPASSPPPAVPVVVTPSGEEEPSPSETPPPPSGLPTPEEPTEEAAGLSASGQTTNDATKTMLLERQKEYKMAALRAKKHGDVEQARVFLKTSKRFDAVVEALEQGQAVDLSGLPPPPAQATLNDECCFPLSAPAAASTPAAPKDVLEALEQRRAKYAEASAQAKAAGDDRKARMHDRIAKQYQSAIRTHKLGKPVNFDELPVPPGFPPIPGQKAAGAEQGFISALETASKLASADLTAAADEDDDEESAPSEPEQPRKPSLDAASAGRAGKTSPSASPDRSSAAGGLSPTALQQLHFLEGRKKQYLKAALQAKQRNDMEQAKAFLRTAKGFDPMMEAARSGQAVDISTVPSPPGDEDEDFILVHHSDVQISEKAEEVYAQLVKILKEQREKCLTHSKQFTHLGNVGETTKFEKMAESCKKSLEVLKLAQSRGLNPPKHHFEERSFHTVRIFPELSSTEMVVVIVKGMNLPAPSGIQTNDLDAYVKFEFPYPSAEQPQKHKTAVVKNTNCPEYNQSFTLSINRNHRGFRRVVTSKGLKLELLHRGGFLRSDKPIGSALVKLDKLESLSEIREIVEVMDGRKATGGRLEVKVRLREPLSGQDMQTSTERWLVIDPSQVFTPSSVRNSERSASPANPSLLPPKVLV
uniref:Coiled-coil and C2 domain-containing protein 1B n=1 Tax=Salarias fasciatus TaxID=181472 RepID=A0A672HMB4_SALFA